MSRYNYISIELKSFYASVECADRLFDPLHNRVAQFAPFAALTGYEAAVGETDRLTVERREQNALKVKELIRRNTVSNHKGQPLQ